MTLPRTAHTFDVRTLNAHSASWPIDHNQADAGESVSSEGEHEATEWKLLPTEERAVRLPLARTLALLRDGMRAQAARHGSRWKHACGA